MYWIHLGFDDTVFSYLACDYFFFLLGYSMNFGYSMNYTIFDSSWIYFMLFCLVLLFFTVSIYSRK